MSLDSYYILPEGNYYLAEDLELDHGIITEGNETAEEGYKTVNVCLNGMQLVVPRVAATVIIGEKGFLCLSDCGNGGNIIGDPFQGLIKLQKTARFILYGGCLENMSGDVIYLGASDTRAEIYGGTIKSSEDDHGVYGGGGEDQVLQLSGSP